MIKIDIVSGFLGAGKTTLIKKLLAGPLKGTQVVLIENEFGEIAVDGGFLKDAGIEIKEMSAGCICCSLVGDFGEALKEVISQYSPERILIEPSGVGKLTDVAAAVETVAKDVDAEINCATAVVDVTKCKMYIKNFGEFYRNQIEAAGTIILTRTDLEKATDKMIDEAIAMIKEINPAATIVTTPLESFDANKLLALMENGKIYKEGLDEHEMHEAHEHEHEHHYDENGVCSCGHHHDDDDDDDDDEHEHHHHDHDEDEHEHHHHDHNEHEHHHHDDDDDDDEHEHHHHDHDDDECGCGCGHDHDHHHHHHHGHDADEVFVSWGIETPHKFTKEAIESALGKLEDADTYGIVLRAKGMVAAQDGTWIYFDMVPGQIQLREGEPEYTGRIAVIGSALKEDNIAALFA